MEQNNEALSYFTNTALVKFTTAQGKIVEKIVCHLWQNKSNPNEVVEIIDNVELYFTDQTKLTISCNENGDGLDAIDYDYQATKLALEKELDGKIKIFSVNASHTKMWKDIIGKTLNIIKIEKLGDSYKANAIMLDFGDEKREIEISPLDGLIIDYFEEDGVYNAFVDDEPI